MEHTQNRHPRATGRMAVALVLAVVAALALVPAPASAAPPAYYPSGPQTGVDKTTPTSGGWSICWSGDYTGDAAIATVLADCDGDYLMLASGPSAASAYDVLAAAPRADVITDTGNSNTAHDANGTGWYYSDNMSWGFAPQGATLLRGNCDYGDSPGFSGPWDATRLCWHTSSGLIISGWRSGSNIALGGDPSFERVILEASEVVGPEDQATLPCTISGGKGANSLSGTTGADTVCGNGGGDTIVLNSPAGGMDIARGGGGDDSLDAADAMPGDRVNGGKGTDTCTIDAGDSAARSCETVSMTT